MSFLSHELAYQSLQARALSYVAATTGLTSLAQTATGFRRDDGSFADDGFLVGDEVVPVGFPSNVLGVVTAVTASTLTVTGTRTASAITVNPGARKLSVGLPTLRAFEGMSLTPIVGRDYITDEFSPSTTTLQSMPDAIGNVLETGDYFLTWYGAMDASSAASASRVRTRVDGLKTLFAISTPLTAGEHTLSVRGNPGPQTGQIVPLTSGHFALQLKVPWWSDYYNERAA